MYRIVAKPDIKKHKEGGRDKRTTVQTLMIVLAIAEDNTHLGNLILKKSHIPTL